MDKFFIHNKVSGLYVSFKPHPNVVWVDKLEKAYRFDTKKKAENFLSNNLIHSTGGKCNLADCEIISRDEEAGCSGDITAADADELMERLTGCLDEMCETVNTVRTLFNYHLAQVQRADIAMEDLLHKIEFTDANTVIGYRMYKTMQELRQRRRMHKDSCMILGVINGSGLLEKLQKARSDIEKMENGMDGRKYDPRVCASLFDAESNAEISESLMELASCVDSSEVPHGLLYREEPAEDRAS